ncbi:Branched-chain amino acid transport system / permease component [Acididesulfobacillus acetoxydans]|uniref:Autoinducer 2 import system permease protein LsrD n=1 Tax=Acididesulfobacillus acetoxydans TaxID=1561005 RepID=A0A8S0WNG3_9FIRM|nr:ABC transporter permease [Acididesulfobacillus acetoxydans]CAA7601314.1 Branched-chain amino acid transport system / permease component [Acididesulfobacillus acetoxydans]CEJ08776.1 Ribose transport system permease protein RbsC [Acididesulfobacillus acetoxydans]
MPKRKELITGRKSFSFKRFFLQWEWLLVLAFIAVNIFDAAISPYFLDMNNILSSTMNFLDNAFIVLPMVFVIMLGEIDISVGSTVALSAVVMGVFYDKFHTPMWLAVLICLAVGALCGLFNGMIIVKFKEIAPMIVTLSTMTMYRGIAQIIIRDQSGGNFAPWFKFLSWGYLGSIPFILVVFAVAAVIFGLLLHKTNFGRRVYAIGNNEIASLYSGIQIGRIKLIIYTLTGFMSGVAALFLSSRMGSTRSDMATGYELNAIAMVVLGGVNIMGGRGRMIGAIIAVFIIGFLKYGLGLINMSSQVVLIVIGLLLAVSVALPNIKKSGGKQRKTEEA